MNNDLDDILEKLSSISNSKAMKAVISISNLIESKAKPKVQSKTLIEPQFYGFEGDDIVIPKHSATFHDEEDKQQVRN